MPLPDIDDLASYGGVKENASSLLDPKTEREAYQVNKALCATGQMTRTAVRAWVAVAIDAAGAPTVAATDHQATWGDGDGLRPSVSVTDRGGGLKTLVVTWPAAVTDELAAAHTVVLRGGFANVSSVTDPDPCDVTAHVGRVAGSPNALAVALRADPSTFAGVRVDVFAV